MITFLEIGKLGRLGNQLFQYAALKSLSLSKEYEIKLPNIKHASWHGQNCLLSNFNLQYSEITNSDIAKITNTYIQNNYTGKSKCYHESFYDIPDNTNLHGFFQNLNYFHQYEKEIKKDFKINSNIQKKCEEYLDSKVGHKKPIVAIHMRRKDNDQIKLNNIRIDNYVNNSLNYFNDEVNFLFFTGGSTQNGNDNSHDVNYIKNNYNKNNYFVSDTNDTMMDFCLMTKCNHIIVGQDSTFSWWSAYLNETPDKIIIAPKQYHTLVEEDDDMFEYKDYYPNDWMLIDLK